MKKKKLYIYISSNGIFQASWGSLPPLFVSKIGVSSQQGAWLLLGWLVLALRGPHWVP